MTPQEVVQAVREGNPKQGWAVYRYNVVFGILNLLGCFLPAAVFNFGAFFLLQGWLNGQLDTQIPLIGMLILAGIFDIYFLWFIPEILHSASSVIVLTEKEAIRNFRGKLYSIPYSKIENLKIVHVAGRRIIPYSYIEFFDPQTSQLQRFVEGRSFGSVQSIYTMLLSKIN